MKTIRVNASEKIGTIKQLNAVGGGPVTCHFQYDSTEYFREAGIPYSRLHDIEYPFGSGEYVDIHCVFPDFDKDENDPKSYNFIFTDEYLKSIINAGAKPFYRLGSTIEHQPIKRYIFPPKDYEKWARICSHIIAHYNEGWANGFEMGVEYWEIWNEPDLTNRCWTGTDEEYFRLYVTASKLLKAEHPYIKIGGPAVTDPNSRMTEPFLQYVKEQNAPLDFLSWHGYYHTPQRVRQACDRITELLAKYGFDHTESIYDEWNYVVAWDDTIQRSIDLHYTPFCGAFMAASMSVMQDTKLDKSFFYDIQDPSDTWNNCFAKGAMVEHGKPKLLSTRKPFYALKSWHLLDELKNQVRATSDEENLYLTAAADGNRLRLLVTYFNDDAGFNSAPPPEQTFALDFGDVSYCRAEICRIDEDHKFETEEFDGKTLKMPGNSFALITLTLQER